MTIEEFNNLIDSVPALSGILEGITTVGQLENALDSYGVEVRRVYDNIEKIKNSSLGEEQKEVALNSMEPDLKDKRNILNVLFQIQNRFNRYLSAYRAIFELQKDRSIGREAYEEKRKELEKELEECIDFIPENMYSELNEKLVDIQDLYKADVPDLDEEETLEPSVMEATYQGLEDRFDSLLGGRDLDEIGLDELDEVERNTRNLQERVESFYKQLAFAHDNHTISDEEYEKLEKESGRYNAVLLSMLDDMVVLRETKEAIKEEVKENIDKCTKNIDKLNAEISKIQEEIREIIINKGSAEARDKKIEEARLKATEIEKYKKELENFQADLEKLDKGGKIVKREPVKIITEERKPEELTPPPLTRGPEAGPKPAPKTAPKPAPKPAPDRKKGETVKPKVAKNYTFDDLIVAGILPKYLKREDLIAICAAYGIKIVDGTTVLTPEQIQILAEDHEIQMAILNQQIYDRNQAIIAKYDALIAKYEAILNDKINEKNFSPEYIRNVKKLIIKCKQERQELIEKNEKIKLMSHEDIMREYDGRAMSKNEKIREKYRDLAAFEEEKKTGSKSKFKKNRIEARMNRLRGKIERLKAKKGLIASKQQQIVNKNAQKYIDRRTKDLEEFYRRQTEMERSVDKINALAEKIELGHKEIEALEADIRAEDELFERIGMRIENGKLKREEGRLKGELREEDFYGRHL